MARERDRGKIIWPSYFDIRLPESGGRRVKKALCIENPDIEKLSEALKKLNLKFEIERDKAYPSKWWKKEGRLVVDTDMKKSALLTAIGKKLKI
ncbi:MAG: signal recognition particle protein Srp19 [Thermoplasmata archaeon]|nr:signal recognition particle protein Srp19 [Thermoplasmata archaeon]